MSYSRTAPKPLQVGQAPRGLLKEKSCGVGAGARVPSFGHSKRSVKFRRVTLSPAVPSAIREGVVRDLLRGLQGKGDREARACRHGEDRVGDRLDGVRAQLAPAFRAVR